MDLKWPIVQCVERAKSKAFERGMHSVRQTRSLAFVESRHSFPFSIVKPFARCIARLRSEMLDPALPPSKWCMIGSKNTSPLKRSASEYCAYTSLVGMGVSSTDRMSFCMPFIASQSGRTDQFDPSFG